MRLSDDHLKTYEEQGFVVVENYYEEEVQRALDTEDIHFRFAHSWARYPQPPAPSRTCT